MDMKTMFLLQLKATHDTNGWFVSLMEAIKNVEKSEADFKPHSHTNSIRETVNHLIYFNERYLQRLLGEEEKNEPLRSNKDTFANVKDLSWEETISTIDSLYAKWEQAIRQAENDDLHKWHEAIAHLMIHNAYHIGQLVFLRKIQNTWDDQHGVH